MGMTASRYLVGFSDGGYTLARCFLARWLRLRETCTRLVRRVLSTATPPPSKAEVTRASDMATRCRHDRLTYAVNIKTQTPNTPAKLVLIPRDLHD